MKNETRLSRPWIPTRLPLQDEAARAEDVADGVLTRTIRLLLTSAALATPVPDVAAPDAEDVAVEDVGAVAMGRPLRRIQLRISRQRSAVHRQSATSGHARFSEPRSSPTFMRPCRAEGDASFPRPTSGSARKARY